MNAHPGLKRGYTGGFTLLEMMITLGVFILLASAVFGLMTSVLQSTGTLLDSQNRRDEVAALNAYLNFQLGEMTAQSTLVSYQRGNGEGLNQNGILFGTINIATAIDAKVQPNGYYVLRVATFTTTAAPDQPPDARQALLQLVGADDPSLIWNKLLGDIKTLDWKFQDLNVTDWVEQWNAGNNPNLIEFTMQPAGDLQQTTMDFWIPKLTRINLRLAAPSTTTTTQPTGTTTPPGTTTRSTNPTPIHP
jgi:type II secretory pathway pseudopilin PulG